MTKRLPNIRPGEILAEEFLTPLVLSQNALARALRIPARRINEIVLGKRAITADTRPASGALFWNDAGFLDGLASDVQVRGGTQLTWAKLSDAGTDDDRAHDKCRRAPGANAD